MKMRPASLLLLIQVFEVCAEFRLLTEGQSLGLSCSPQQGRGPLRGLHLYHQGPRTQTTLLSVAESGAVRVDPARGARLQLSGGLSSPRVNVSVSSVRPSDSGLYLWELSYRERNGSGQLTLSEHKVLLLVEGTTCRCSHGYIQLLLIISAAAGLLLLAFSWMIIDNCVRARRAPTLQPHPPIYEEMSRKLQTPGSPQNNCEASAPLEEEVNFPVYSNPNILLQPQDNYYACPRQLALRGHV
ncbi:uncharacterized protein LOC108239286 isoform X2 [Kryptolebias marmoratus]|uniref:uncharacterized protein LOC108239286 isoform X2 n=1 Tax=Kryptolebias marmoratus TaxID=37003 RepID=UPI0007F8D828|nr:uncharacterized protein LOC108239286 isoform X2 [Kryptolebias marmoratus]